MIRRLVLLAALAGPAVAQTPRVSVEPSAPEFTVGDRVFLDLVVEHAVTDSIVWPEITDPMGDFEVLEAEAIRPTVQDERQISVLRLTLTAFELGAREFPPVTIGVVGPSGESRMEIETDPATLEVVSVGLDESGDIREIRGPRAIERNWLLVLPWLLLAAALGALGFWAYRRFAGRETPERRPPSPPVPPRPPHEIALEAFERLRLSPLLERGEVKQYFVEASEILRRYLEARFAIEAMELPSAEIMHDLRRTDLPVGVLEQFEEFFRRADLVKFAKHRPAPEVAEGIVDLGEGIVGETAGSAGEAGRAGPADGVVTTHAPATGIDDTDQPAASAVPAGPADSRSAPSSPSLPVSTETSERTER